MNWQLYKAGFFVGMGATGGFFAVLFIGAMVTGILTPKDNCDGPEGRCGMSIKTDHFTGLQYLVTPKGGIYPRMDKNGQQVMESAQ